MRQKRLTEMKNGSNMFNDNSIETEGVPADKTAEIPKVVDSTEEENAKKPLVLFGREFSRKQVCAAGAGILCAAILIGGFREIHEMSFRGALLSILFTLLGILLILFMALLLWSLFQQVFVFFAQLWDEIIKMIG